MALSTTAAVAGTAAAAAYLEAKTHVAKDFKTLWAAKTSEWDLAQKAKQNRVSLWYPFEDNVRRLPPGEECVWSRSGVYTWRETHAMCCRYAQWFLQNGVRPGELVAFCLTNTPQFMFALFGTWAIGTAPALVNYNLAGDALVHCLKVSGAKVLLVDGDPVVKEQVLSVRDRIEGELGMKILVLDEETTRLVESSDPKRPERKYREKVTAEFPMTLLYTSGSTGHPKACSFPIARAWGLIGPRVRTLGLEPGPNGDRWYNCMPLYHGTGCNTAVSCFLSGLTLCIGKKFSTSRFWDDIRDSKATAIVYVGETARYLLAAPPSPRDRDHNLKVMFGNGMRPDVWPRFQERFGVQTVSEFFNSTEGVFALLNVCKGPYLQNSVGHHGLLLRTLLHNVYVPVKINPAGDDQIYRDPQTGFAVRNSYEEGGEIICGVDPSAFVGYYHNEAATNKKFERDVFKKGDLYYRTGDALRRTKDGRWFFLDRLGDTFRWKSENVSTAEVAEVLGHFPGVNEAVVYGVLVPGHDGRAGMATVTISPSVASSFSYSDLLAHCRQRLPKYAVPVFLRVTVNSQAMHNNKQNKVPLKKDGFDLKLIRPSGDKVMWLPSQVGMGADEWVPFEETDAARLNGGQKEAARL